MKAKMLVSFFLSLLLLVNLVYPAFAFVDPLSVPNNKIGVHILFTTELQEAADLVNSTGGDWGYVTIPVQAIDKDLKKWQKFMDDASEYHLIPILRLATENYYFNTKVWRKPTEEDILDFANFLHSLYWPTKNRYVIVFNEVNRADEWSGPPDPKEYALLLQYAVTVFKSKSQDFFILSAGLDNAASNVSGLSMNQYDFLRGMNAAVPGIFNQIDGFASHSYPNPGFSQPPSRKTNQSVASFIYEKNLVNSLSNKNLPVFITETGWSRNELSDETISSYYQEVFSDAWFDPTIVAISPFLLRAESGPFVQFSLVLKGKKTKIYETIKSLPKTAGLPSLVEKNLPKVSSESANIPIKDFSSQADKKILGSSIVVSQPLKIFFKTLLQIPL